MNGHVDFKKLKLFEARLDAMVSAQTRSRAADRVGKFLSSQMKVNAIRQDIKQTAKLQGSISYTQKTIGTRTLIEAGVFGIFYARFHEFGTQNEKGTSPRRIYYRIKEKYERMGHLGRPGKGVFDKKTGKLKARPFVYPALEDNKDTILQMIREEVQNARGK